MFNVVKAFGSIFSTQGYSAANNMLIRNYVNTNFNYFNEEAVVDESIYPNQTGRVRFQGSWWPGTVRSPNHSHTGRHGLCHRR